MWSSSWHHNEAKQNRRKKMRNIKTTNWSNPSLYTMSKMAGFMFLFAFIVPTLNWAFILSKFVVPDDALATGKNIMVHEFLFRIGISIELIMSMGLVVLGVALYALLKSINKNLALLALAFKLVETAIAVVITLGSFIAILAICENNSYLSAYNQDSLQAFAGFMLHKHTVLYSFPMVFLGLDMMLFCYLFFKSRYIPRLLAGFGVLSFALIFIHAVMYVIAPQYASMSISQIVFWGPSGLFEILIGSWLLVKGINRDLHNPIKQR